ncbi:hypothetical protein [Lapillicoccus jejuensis]|uniref:Uncharacterized protein n=1 Tax=Lapillicoccus jejuensis TaxID=402171 RepID=A0A542E0N1_9MICO|nr:hypothetical protein [Lapillicoccus jejuensis]TQJ08903.1 hypothetical protein FB458_2003 [Lapillicoccus jejuensis]
MTDQHTAVVRQVTTWRTTVAAEHDTQPLLGDDVVLAATHFLPDHAGVAVVLECTDGSLEVLGASGPHAEIVAGEHRSRTSGRVFHFSGSLLLEEEVTVATLLTTTSVDVVEGLGGTPVDPSAVLVTRRFVRPTFTGGRLRLLVRPAAGGRVACFEQPDPTPCCAAHS